MRKLFDRLNKMFLKTTVFVLDFVGGFFGLLSIVVAFTIISGHLLAALLVGLIFWANFALPSAYLDDIWFLRSRWFTKYYKTEE